MSIDDCEQAALLEQVRAAFAGHDPVPFATALMRYGAQPHHHEASRVRSAIIELCAGDPAQLDRQLAIALEDYRDVLAAVSRPRPNVAQVEAERAAVRDLLERWGDS